MTTTDVKTEAKKILVVDDDAAIRQLMRDALSEAGYRIELAATASEARAKITTFEPHLVLTDFEMPGLTGLEFLKELRAQQNYVTVIFVSARSELDAVVESLRSGADDYVRKPFRFQELLARVEVALRNNDTHRELRDANLKLQEMVERDYLTGLYNMRSIYDRIDHELARARRFKRPVAAVMIDMDHFKSVNDQNDHLFGSFVLKEMGQLVASSLREVDFAARYGGDEFLVVLCEADANGAAQFCERLRSKVEGHTFSDGQSQIQLTISLGFSVTVGNKIDARQLVRQADLNLYRSKEAGRNRVVGD